LQVLSLTPTSYIVLGLLELCGEATPYELKQAVSISLGNFWSIQHAQLYSEPERLAGAGYLKERREEGGRRRRRYSLTAKGRRALEDWREEPTDQLSELRDPGLLKLFFGADQAALAEVQLEAHRRKLAEYEALRRFDSGEEPRGPWLTLESGIGHEREWIRFWEGLL
jgi:DNA-binding PadR family transcriptional regulator